jgi:hypothetical protein
VTGPPGIENKKFETNEKNENCDQKQRACPVPCSFPKSKIEIQKSKMMKKLPFSKQFKGFQR